MGVGNRRQGPNGVALEGPWTWQGRPVDDVVSLLLMEDDSIANLAQRQAEQRERQAEHRARLSRELDRTAEYFTAALQVIRARQRGAGDGSS